MELTRKHKVVFTLCLLFAIGIMIAAAITFAGQPLLPFIPGNGEIDFLVLIGVPLILSMLLPFLVPKLTPAMVKIVRKVRKSTTLVHMPTEPNPKFRSFMGRSVLPVLLMFSIAYMLAPYIPSSVFGGQTTDLVAIYLGLLLSPIILTISLSIWTFQDQGIGLWHPAKKRDVQILEGAGRWLSAFLRGYAGISAIVSYVQVVVSSVHEMERGGGAVNFFTWAGPILAMLGYFAFWGVTAVLYEKRTVLNNAALQKKYAIPTYEAILRQVAETTTNDPRT